MFRVTHNLGRSFAYLLAMLILFGVAAVISTVGIGKASSDSVTNRIAALGTNLLTVSPGSTSVGGVFGGGGSANTLTMIDVTEVPGAEIGEVVTIYGVDGEHTHPANQVARSIGTVTSDLLCAVSARVPRLYVS